MECPKHFFEIVGAQDHFLMGYIFFKCKYCGLPGQADRFWLYQEMTQRVGRKG